MLIFSRKIYMDGHADFFSNKLTWRAMLIFPKNSSWRAMLIFYQFKKNIEGHADFTSKNKHGWPCEFFLEKLTSIAMLIFFKKINMEGQADFLRKN